MSTPSSDLAGAGAPAGSIRDLILGVVIVVTSLALIFWIIPEQVNDAGSFGLPPSLAPRALAWLMLGTGVVLVAQNLRARGPDPDAPAFGWHDAGHLALTLAAVAVMLLIMGFVGDRATTPYVGFWVAAPLGLIAFTLIYSGAPLWAYVFNALAAPAVIYAGFWWGLEVPLP